MNWSLRRRLVQVVILLGMLAPLVGWQGVRGNYSAAWWLGINLVDPLAGLQSMLAGKSLVPALLLGTLAVTSLYAVVGGRTFCSWVCPLHLLLETTDRMRRRFRLPDRALDRRWKYYLLALVLVLSLARGLPVYELFNPVALLLRAVIYGSLAGLLLVGGIVVWELTGSRRGWCRYLCPVGGFYALLGHVSWLRPKLDGARCNGCHQCSRDCLVGEQLQRLIKQRGTGSQPLLLAECTNCAACLDACSQQALSWGGYRSWSNRLRRID